MEERSGFITRYLVSGPLFTDFIADKTDKNQIRYEQYLRSIVAERDKPAPTDEIRIGGLSELGLPWEYNYPCSGFVNFSQFAVTPKKVELLAAAGLIAEEELEIRANLWTYTAADVWLNGRKICSVHEPVYKPMKKQEMKLVLKKGYNALLVRMQNLAVRDTRNIFGIQLLEHTDKVETALPDAGHAEPFLALDRWLSAIEMKGNRICFPGDAPCKVYFAYGDDKTGADVTGRSYVDVDDDAAMAAVYGEIGNKRLVRKIELLQNNKPVYRSRVSAVEARRAMYEELAAMGSNTTYESLRFGLFYVLARWHLGQKAVHDEAHLKEAMDRIERREDCSDFFLAGLLRLMQFYSLPSDLAERAERVILNYRYWMTEEGSDGMCFWSENHALMFYICAYMAGSRYPDKRFPRSGRTGLEVSQTAGHRIRQWLEDVEEYGFEEFLSADYMCVTLGALLNVVDFMEDEESARAAKLVDLMLKSFACHTFRGSIIAPQARIYRSVILPFTQAAQSLMHLLNPEVPAGNSEWIVFLMGSKYRLPYRFASLMDETMEMEYRTGNAYVKLNKQPDYMLTSVQSPRYDEKPVFWDNISFDESADVESNPYIKSFNERFHGTSRFEPGVFGYQQHMWYAALDNDTVVFANHPGELADDGGMRPGYWYGNGVMPAIKQEGSLLGSVYDIGDNHPVSFTHLFFPACKFDSAAYEGPWLFGQKDGGYAAIWCSEEMVPHNDRLFNCEYRAYGSRMAYLCLCGSASEFESLEQFKAHCRQLAPAFDPASLTLSASGGYALTAVRSENSTQYV
ncbi:hypothetical protein KP806_20180 [Paenibacillus sp. N4]|uniref:hypothetical protein n=1 Tax=Paenibacillus vietnamensis TaxID=2590547 RepID=UPI001CD18346|nr:hypothetical protein [Paenibacillus vietnamensis]MCA0757380.1 hypothetical protein [Paenibacillus vietnamensis]